MQTTQQPVESPRHQPHSFLPQQPVVVKSILDKCVNGDEFTDEEAELIDRKPWLFMFYSGFTARHASPDSTFSPASNIEHRLQAMA